MDKTVFMQNVTTIGHKKGHEPEKLSESSLCDEIHNNLRVLSSIHPFSNELMVLFDKGMFLKSNPKAFPHIMKYLFTICDSNEFKKKFCWPLYNKAAEATFRNSTMEFLTKLNGKYGLGFAEIKNKILVFPGGMEFMRVIYELTRLSMQLIMKRNGMLNDEHHRFVTLNTSTERTKIIQSLYETTVNLNEQVEKHSADLKLKTKEVYNLLQNATTNTNIIPSDILEDVFIANWADVHEKIIENIIEPDTKRLEKFQIDCDALETKLSAICNRQLKINLNALTSFSMEMQRLYPQHYQQMSTIVTNNRIDLNHLIQATHLALPEMVFSIESHKPRNSDALVYESNYLNKISSRLSDLIRMISELNDDSCDTIVNAQKSDEHSTQNDVLKDLSAFLLSTPTISHNMAKHNETGIGSIKRISLIDDVTHLKSTAASKQSLSKTLNPILEESTQFGRSFRMSTLSPIPLAKKEDKPTKFDPMKLLLSIKKKEKFHPVCSLKPKSINFTNQSNNSQHEHFVINDTTLSVPDFSSTLLRNDGIDHINATEQINNSMKLCELSDRDIGDRIKGSQSFIAIANDVNQSPSGRIELTSKMDLNDSKPMKLIDKIKSIEETQPVVNEANGLDSENDQNVANQYVFNSRKLIDENDESLLDISDGILTNLDFDDSS